MGKRNSGEGGFFHDIERDIQIYKICYTDDEDNRKRKKFAPKPHVRPRTYEKYSTSLNKYILAKYENILLSDLKVLEKNWLDLK